MSMIFCITGIARLRFSIVWCVAVLFLFPVSLQAAEKYTLEEPATDQRPFSVDVHLAVTGQLQTAIGSGKAVGLKLNVDGNFSYRERRISGTGRDAQSLRSVRYYDKTEVKIDAGSQSSSARLRKRRRLIVAQGRRSGVEVYSPNGSLTYNELDVLRMPGDSLAVIALLPRTPVAVGETWKPESWVHQMFCNLEASLKSEFNCRLDSVESDTAKVTFSGSIEGASGGAVTSVSVTGYYLYDLSNKQISRVESTQTEKRSVGTVSPGMDVTAKLTMTRSISSDQGLLTDELISIVPLEPPVELIQLAFESPWNVRFAYDRNWHIFHQTKRVAVLRLLDKGSLIAQCNISPIPSAKPGEHTSEETFQADIRESLGDRLKSLEKAEQIKTDDGRFLYRVIAVGSANGILMQWHYYLCAGPSGQQVSFVFAIEQKTLEQVANRDLGIVQSLQFIASGN